MKRTIKLLALICALAMVFTLAACGEKKEDSSSEDSSEAEDSKYGWVTYDMPDGYELVDESDAYVTITEEADNHHIIKIFLSTFYSDTMESVIKRAVDLDPKRFKSDKEVKIGNYTWSPVRFKFNDNDSVKLYTTVDDEHYAYLTVYEMTETDPAVQTVVNSVKFDASKYES